MSPSLSNFRPVANVRFPMSLTPDDNLVRVDINYA